MKTIKSILVAMIATLSLLACSTASSLKIALAIQLYT